MSGKFLSIGEPMVELSQAGDGNLRKGFAGDTLNTAWYARAYFPSDWSVDYFTALGDDPLSEDMLAFIKQAGIGTDHITRIAGGTPGLYLINLKDGERTFSYWRSNAAARQLANDELHLRSVMENADVIYFSGITLGILADQNAIDTFLAELRRAKASGKLVAFDPNIRPRLWQSKDHMLATITEGARASSMVMPSFDDEKTHFDDESVDATIARYKALGVTKLVVKDGKNGATHDFDGARSHDSLHIHFNSTTRKIHPYGIYEWNAFTIIPCLNLTVIRHPFLHLRHDHRLYMCYRHRFRMNHEFCLQLHCE